MSQNETEGTLDLDARYGRSPAARRRTRWFAIAVAIAVALAVAAWVIWGSLFTSTAQVDAHDTGHRILSDREVEVEFELSVPTGSESSCAIQALNSSFTIVGWKIVDLPPSGERTRVFTEIVRTTELAVTGLIYRCWLT